LRTACSTTPTSGCRPSQRRLCACRSRRKQTVCRSRPTSPLLPTVPIGMCAQRVRAQRQVAASNNTPTSLPTPCHTYESTYTLPHLRVYLHPATPTSLPTPCHTCHCHLMGAQSADGWGGACAWRVLTGEGGCRRRVWTTGLEWNLDGQEASALSFGTFISTSNRICAQVLAIPRPPHRPHVPRHMWPYQSLHAARMPLSCPILALLCMA